MTKRPSCCNAGQHRLRIVLHAENVLEELYNPDARRYRGSVYEAQYHAAHAELADRRKLVDDPDRITDPDELAALPHYDALDDLSDRLEDQRERELTNYGNALQAAIIESLTGLTLPVPVHVEVLPDYQSNDQATVPVHGGLIEPLSPIDDAIMLAPTPTHFPALPGSDLLPGTIGNERAATELHSVRA